MKLKNSFRGGVLPFRKIPSNSRKPLDVRQFTFGILSFLLWLVLFLMATCKAKAQGQVIKDIKITHIINYPKANAKLSDFRGKLLILDFWATWCTPCVAMLPKMDSLQREFGAKIQVLPVTYQSEQIVRAFLKKRSPSVLPDVIEDKELSAIFPHQYIPHYVWIGPDGEQRAVTSATEVTRENILTVLAGKPLSVAQKIDIDVEKPLFSAAELPLNNLRNYSVFFKGRVEGTGAGIHHRHTDKLVGLAMTNYPLLNMFQVCGAALISKFNPKQTVLLIRDSSGFIIPKGKEIKAKWYRDNSYSLDLIVPIRDSARLYDKVLEFVGLYTDYKVSVEKHSVKCWELSLTGDCTKLKSKYLDDEDRLGDSTARWAHHIPITNLVSWLSGLNADWPLIIDRTGYKGFLDVGFSPGLSALRSELLKQGLRLTERQEEIYQLVVRDNNNLNLNPNP